MARARTVKPSFFVNEDLGLCHPFARLLFIGLWTLADKTGRLEDRPIRIKSQLLPYDDKINIDDLLDELYLYGFIVRYTHENTAIIQIVSFISHQKPHPNEASFNLPELQDNSNYREISGNLMKLHEKKLNYLPYKDIRIKGLKESKEKEERKEPENLIIKIGSHFKAKQEQIDELIKQDGHGVFTARVECINDYCASHGKSYKDYPAAYRQFKKRETQKPGSNQIEPQRNRPEHKIIKASAKVTPRDVDLIKSITDKAFRRNERVS